MKNLFSIEYTIFLCVKFFQYWLELFKCGDLFQIFIFDQKNVAQNWLECLKDLSGDEMLIDYSFNNYC